jgi:hypothetical protein
VFRRPMLFLPAVLVAMALPVAPALAGEDDGSGPVRLHESQGCVSGDRAKATVTGDNIDSVKFFVDSKLVKTVTEATSRGTYVFSMRCARLSVGAHRARAVVSESGSNQTLRFQITRARQTSPQFTG